MSKEDETTKKNADEQVFEDKVVQTMIAVALESVDGLLSINGQAFTHVGDQLSENQNLVSGINVDMDKEKIKVDLVVCIEYGKNIPTIYKKIQTVIIEEFERMTSFEVVEMNVTIADVMTRDQYKAEVTKVEKEITDSKEKE